MKPSIKLVLGTLMLTHCWAPITFAAPPPTPATPATPPKPAVPPKPAAAAPINELDMTSALKTGSEAFDKGDYATAATSLGQYVDNAIKLGMKENLDKISYVAAISAAQTQQWAPALTYYKYYETNYPQGEYLKDVAMSIGKIAFLSGDVKAAITQFTKIKNVPELKDQVLPLLAEAFQKDDQGGEAVKLLEDYLKSGFGSTERINAALRLAGLYLATGNTDKGVNILEKIKSSPSAADFVIIINQKALETASELLRDSKPESALQALQALQAVRRKNEVIRLQTQRNTLLKARIAEWTRQKSQLLGAAGAKYQGLIEEGNQRLKQLESLLSEVEKNDSYDAVVIYQIGTCFATLRRFWESELAFRTIETNYKTYPDIANAAYGRIVALISLKKNDKALKATTDFLKNYPSNKLTEKVSEIVVTMLAEAGEFEQAKKIAQQIVKEQPDGPATNKMMMSIIIANFAQGSYKEARAACEEYLKKFPNDAFKEEVDYRMALTYFFDNDHKKTLELLGKYVNDYSNGAYVTDARYRLGIVMYGEEMSKIAKVGNKKSEYESNFHKVIAEVEAIMKADPNSNLTGELYALIGDCYDQMTFLELKSQNIIDEKSDDQAKLAGMAYYNGALKADNDDVLSYCMEQARTKLQAAGMWKEIRILHEEFVRTRPDHPERLTGISWVCKALSREAKNPEEKAAAIEKIKKYLAENILPNLNKPAIEGVERLIEQLAQACIPKRKPRAAAPVTEPGKEATVATPPPAAPVEDPYEAGTKELDKWIGSSAGKLNGTGEARIKYAKIMLLKMVPPKVDPADPKKRIDRTPEIEKLMDELGQSAKPDDLSSTMLAFVGDHLMKKGVVEKATQCYNRLIQFYPKSDYVDFGLVGLGNIAFDLKDYATAEKNYAKARDDMPGSKYPNALMGIAKSQIMMGNFKDPKKPLEEIAGTKEWKGELTAEALYWLGECAFAEKNYAVAANYFQRIYLSFSKYPEWVIKGYDKAAECFAALGQKDDSRRNLEEARDYLKKRKLETSPFMQTIKDRAAKLSISLAA